MNTKAAQEVSPYCKTLGDFPQETLNSRLPPRVLGAVSGGEDVLLRDERSSAPEHRLLGSVQPDGGDPGPLTSSGLVAANHTEGRDLRLPALWRARREEREALGGKKGGRGHGRM